MLYSDQMWPMHLIQGTMLQGVACRPTSCARISGCSSPSHCLTAITKHPQYKPDDSDTITAPSSPASRHRIITPAGAPDHAAQTSILVSSGRAAWQTWATGDLLQAACDWLSVGADEQSREQRVWSLAEDALQEHLDSGEARAQHQWDWDIFRCCSCCAPVTG